MILGIDYMSQVLDLLAQAKQLEIDSDHLVRQCGNVTQLLLRLGENTYYPDELHTSASETILVLQGVCHLLMDEETLILTSGQQVTVEANQLHKFLPASDCCLSLTFEKVPEKQD